MIKNFIDINVAHTQIRLFFFNVIITVIKITLFLWCIKESKPINHFYKLNLYTQFLFWQTGL